MMNRRLLAAAVATAVMLTLPAAASAAVTIGSTAPTAFAVGPPPVSTDWTVLQTGSPTGGTSYVVPDGTWVVKTVSARLSSGQFGRAEVRFARPQNGSYLWLGSDQLDVTETTEPTVFTANAAAERKVKGGDLLGLTYSGTAAVYGESGAGYTWATSEEDPPDGSEADLTAGSPDGAYAISATLEPDKDEDGYGDDTQDACPADAEKQAAPCATDLAVTHAVSATTIAAGGQLTSTFVISNNGPAKAVNVRLQSTYGQYLFHKSWPASCENLTGQTFCTVGDIDPGQTVIVAGVVGAADFIKSPVSEARGGFVVSDSRELNSANNKGADFLINVVAAGAVPPPGGNNPPAATCKVPKLKGKTLTQAKKLLRTAGCATGKVTKPKRKPRRGFQLTVSKSRPAAGATVARGTKVALTLKATRKKRR